MPAATATPVVRPGRASPAAGKPRPPRASPARAGDKPKAEPKILFQSYFKSVGPRTYAAQVKEAGNGNHFLVLTEGKRDESSGDVKKTKLFVFSEDFVEFFRLMKQTSEFIKANPVSPKVKQKREKFWAKQNGSPKNGSPAGEAASAAGFDRTPDPIRSPSALSVKSRAGAG